MTMSTKTTGAKTAGELVTTPTSVVIYSLLVLAAGVATGVAVGRLIFGRYD